MICWIQLIKIENSNKLKKTKHSRDTKKNEETSFWDEKAIFSKRKKLSLLINLSLSPSEQRIVEVVKL